MYSKEQTQTNPKTNPNAKPETQLPSLAPSSTSRNVGPRMVGRVIHIKENADGTYDGMIQTNEKNSYPFYDVDYMFNLDSKVAFNMASTSRVEAVHIKPTHLRFTD
jgi:hypothetical protein